MGELRVLQCLYTIWGAGEPAPVSAIAPALMDINVLALGGRLTFLAPFSGPGGPVMLLSAIMGMYRAVRRPWGAGDVAICHYGCVWRRSAALGGPVTLLSTIVGVYGDVLGPWGPVTLLSAIFILALRVVCLFPVCRSYKDGGP